MTSDTPQKLNPTKDFGVNLELYHCARIGYPPAFIQAVFDEFHIRPDYTGVEIGSGSGQLTQVLVKGLTIKPAMLYCIEPDARSIAFCQEQFASAQLHYINKTFEDTSIAEDISEGTCDLIVAGDSGHWLEPEAARQQFCRLLKPEGRVIFFNRFIEREQDPIGKKLHELLMEHCGFYKTLVQTTLPNRYYNVIFDPDTKHYRTQSDYKEWDKKELYEYLSTNSPTMEWVKTHEADAYEHVINPLFGAHAKNDRLTIPWKQTILTGTLRRN